MGEHYEAKQKRKNSLLDSLDDSGGHSESLYPNLSAELSDEEEIPKSLESSQTLIDHELLNSQSLNKSGIFSELIKNTESSPTRVLRSGMHSGPVHRATINRTPQSKQETNSNSIIINKTFHGQDQRTLNDGSPTLLKPIKPNLGASQQKPQRSTLESMPKSQISKNDNWFWFLLTIGSAILIVVASFYSGKITFWLFATADQPDHFTKPFVCNEIKALHTEFPEQSDKLWAFLKSGIERVANKKPTKPSIFMLLHEPDVNIKVILNSIVQATQTCLGTVKYTPVHLTADTLKSSVYISDYGRVISDYKSALSNSAIMIVENFNEVPPTVAQAFHTICDGETPYVARSVIFLTMPVNQINERDNPFKIAEKHLTKLWGDSLKDNVLGPLLYRVTDVTLHINR